MRLFIAIELPKEIIEELSRLQKELKQDGLRLVKAFHLTLKFLGEVPDPKLEALKEGLSMIKFKSFDAELSEIGVFPDYDHIRVIWAGVKADQLYSLQKEIELSTERLGFLREKDFKPHLTLARVNFLKDKEALKNKLNSLKINNTKFKVEDFRLIKSTLTPTGPIYEVLGLFKLG